MVLHALHALQLTTGDAEQGLVGPGQEPVDGAAVHEGREHAHAHAQRRADGRHCEDYVEIIADRLDEVRPHRVLGLAAAVFLGPRPRVADDAVGLVGREEVGHLARVEDVVEVLEERLVDDLGVVDEEHRRLCLPAAGRDEELLLILTESIQAVALGEGDGELGRLRHRGAEQGAARAAAAADTDQEGVAARLPQDARDAADVAHTVAEEDELHWRCVREVVLVVGVLELLLDLGGVLRLLVDPGVDGAQEVAPHYL
mmetsp:Transcript_33594/g.89014  ORF Transcript_33594/g.89014 Transcript_33594/m.89014 type:complete len:257 (+) Transcript_33594:826-1596(+)